ncbi:MAG: trigger factor [Lachnospiraceae bacterium]|nr:trigger factor [Lachnospiraceae bacterium]
MKKKLLATLLAVSMVMSLCACGQGKEGEKTETTETTETSDATEAKAGVVSTKDYNPDDYVTVGDYEGVEVTVDVVNFTDADVEKSFNEEVEYYVDYAGLYEYEATDKEVVEEGDIVNIDYVGKKDGVAFDGGTAQGHHLEIGSGSFIDGFEDGLIGKKVGETTTLNLTFPEEYHSEELAGAAVTFDVTIHSIDTGKMPEITDELIVQMELGFDSIAAYKEDIRSYLQESCEETNESERKAKVWNAVYDLCTIKEPPQEMVDDIVATIKQNAASYADYYGVGLDEFVTNYMGYTMEEYEEECKQEAIQSAKQKLTVAAVAKKVGIELTDDEVKKTAEAEYEGYGYESADALLNGMGKGAYYDYLLSDKVYEYLETCVTIKENAPVSILADEEELDEEEISDEEDGEVIVLDEEDVEVIEGEELEEEDLEEELEEDPTEELILQTEE